MKGRFVSWHGSDIEIEHDPDLPNGVYAVSPWCSVMLNGKPASLADIKSGDELVMLGQPAVSIDARDKR